MKILGQMYFVPMLGKDGTQIASTYIGEITAFEVTKSDGTIERFEKEPVVHRKPEPVLWRDLPNLKKGEIVYLDMVPVQVEKVFPTDGEVWVIHMNGTVTHHKYFEIRVIK